MDKRYDHKRIGQLFLPYNLENSKKEGTQLVVMDEEDQAGIEGWEQ